MLKILLSLSLSLAASDFTVHLQELATAGFTVIPGIFAPEEMAQVSHHFQAAKERAFHIIENTPSKPRVFNENNTNNHSVYWKTEHELILQAGKGRYDFYQGFSDPTFHSDTLEELMRHLLVGEFTHYSGVIYSSKGSSDQYWHRDTHTLANIGTDGSKLVAMDDFYFTVLIPVTVPLTLENGTTEFMVGSHRLAAEWFSQCKKAQVEVPLGSALVFNGKINHRGRANHSEEDRPALYLVYHKKWYNDQYRLGIP